MSQLIDIKVEDQYQHRYDAKAQLRQVAENAKTAELPLFKKIDHIIVEDEIILPSIELFFESQKSNNIYKIIE
ncbi:hypothetical protein [Acinetobacter indicus]|uniref:hypothetical protein n=1 Tax=Acinetobacter indicus TaxID=756892 RepID=UPI000CECCC29|nr:hypothetical protein [Acinetobacter indicus]MDM1244182.1 hypothetical protein [Acinetobacter indicus]MDM1288235.1 hypothetical protein [Acinetobacter indicus]